MFAAVVFMRWSHRRPNREEVSRKVGLKKEKEEKDQIYTQLQVEQLKMRNLSQHSSTQRFPCVRGRSKLVYFNAFQFDKEIRKN